VVSDLCERRGRCERGKEAEALIMNSYTGGGPRRALARQDQNTGQGLFSGKYGLLARERETQEVARRYIRRIEPTAFTTAAVVYDKQP